MSSKRRSTSSRKDLPAHPIARSSGNRLADEDMDKAFVSVMGPYGELTPCNSHIGALMKSVKTGIAESGGVGRNLVSPWWPTACR